MRKTMVAGDPMPLLKGLTGLVLALMGAAAVYALWITALNWNRIQV